MTEQEKRQEREWIKRLACGDATAISDVYDAHARRLFGHAICVLRCRPDAEDAVQSTFVRLASMQNDLLRIRELVPYLHQMVHNECLQIVRRERHRAEVPFDGLLFEASGAGPLEQAQLAELDQWIGKLDQDLREALCLRIWNGLTFREIGKVTGVSMFTAASRCRIALQRLRKEMGAA